VACVRNVLVIKNVLQLRSSAEERLLLGPRVPSWRRSHWDFVPVGPRSSGSKGIGKNGELAKMCRYQAPAGGPWRFDWPRPPPNESIESPGSAGVDGSAVNHPPPNRQGTHWGLHPAFVFQSITNSCEKPSDCLVFLLRGRSSHRTLVTWQTCHDPSLWH
jgi:hypothetical protein